MIQSIKGGKLSKPRWLNLKKLLRPNQFEIQKTLGEIFFGLMRQKGKFLASSVKLAAFHWNIISTIKHGAVMVCGCFVANLVNNATINATFNQ